MSLCNHVHCIQEICDDRVLAVCTLVPGENLVERVENPETEISGIEDTGATPEF